MALMNPFYMTNDKQILVIQGDIQSDLVQALVYSRVYLPALCQYLVLIKSSSEPTERSKKMKAY